MTPPLSGSDRQLILFCSEEIKGHVLLMGALLGLLPPAFANLRSTGDFAESVVITITDKEYKSGECDYSRNAEIGR